MTTLRQPLSTNGLIMPLDFPVAQYEFVHKKIVAISKTSNSTYEHFAGAWNAVAYRFLALTEYEASFSKSLTTTNTDLTPSNRHRQERDLYGFFCNGFSIFEACFYSIFSLGAFLSAANFPIATAKDQQRISPASTTAAMVKAFSSDPINKAIDLIISDAVYIEWREIRNILTHRAAPGRTFFVGIGNDDVLPDQWKIKNIPLNEKMASARRADLSKLLNVLMHAIEQFVQSHF